MGLVWAMGYALLESLQPGAFHYGKLADTQEMVQIFVYYSFVTLSTLGYGDVTPATPVARSMSAAEAIVGQLYLAVFVAALVGRYLSAGSDRRAGRP